MRPEHLGIGDKTFLINRLIQQAPINTLIREFFKNADENAALAPEGKRIVEIKPTLVDGVRKLTFWNTGIGMSAPPNCERRPTLVLRSISSWRSMGILASAQRCRAWQLP